MTAMGVRVVLCALFAAHSVLAEEGAPSATPSPAMTDLILACTVDVNARFQDNACFFLGASPVTFESGDDACKQVHSKANLASIRSQEENDAATEWAVSRGHLEGTHPEGVWIGGSEPSTEAVWSWSDGADFEYTNWHENQPNNWNGDQHCAILWKTDGTWQDVRCTEQLVPMCALRLQDFSTEDDEPAPAPAANAPPFTIFCQNLIGGEAIGEACFFLGREEVMWHEGADECEAANHHATLATIYSRDENDLVRRLSEEYLWERHRIASPEDMGVWIGASDQIVEGTWIWPRGRSLAECGYLNWADGAPGDEDCAAMARSDGSWDDVACDKQKRPMCVLRLGERNGFVPNYSIYTTAATNAERLRINNIIIDDLRKTARQLEPAARRMCARHRDDCQLGLLQHCSEFNSLCQGVEGLPPSEILA